MREPQFRAPTNQLPKLCYDRKTVDDRKFEYYCDDHGGEVSEVHLDLTEASKG